MEDEDAESDDTTASEDEDGRLRCSLTVQVLKPDDDDIWTEASEKTKAETVKFTLSGLEENTSYRLRLRTSISVEPLRFMFSELAEPEHDPDGTNEDAAEWLGQDEDVVLGGLPDLAGAVEQEASWPRSPSAHSGRGLDPEKQFHSWQVFQNFEHKDESR